MALKLGLCCHSVPRGSYLKWFVNPKIDCAAAGLVCVAHIFTHFKTLVAGFSLCVVQLKRQREREGKSADSELDLKLFQTQPSTFPRFVTPCFYCTQRHWGLSDMNKDKCIALLRHQISRTGSKCLEANVVFTHLHFLGVLHSEKQPYSQQQTNQSHKVEKRQHGVSS